MEKENRLYSISLGVASLQGGLVGVATALSPATCRPFQVFSPSFFVGLGLAAYVLQRKLPSWNLRSSTASEIGTEPGIEIPPLLNGRQPVLEGVHVAWRSALALNPTISFCPRCRDSFSALVSL